MEFNQLAKCFNAIGDAVNIEIVTEILKHFEIDLEMLSTKLNLEMADLNLRLQNLCDSGLIKIEIEDGKTLCNVRVSAFIEMREHLNQIVEGWGQSFWDYAKPQD